MKRITLLPILALLAACGETAMEPAESGDVLAAAPSFSAVADGINAALANQGADYVLYMAEYITSGEGDELGQTVYFRNVGNKQLGTHWVPGDARRAWGDPGGGITFVIDDTEGTTASGLTQAETDAAIRSAMDTWSGVQCSMLPLVELGPYTGWDLGVVQYQLGFGGVNGVGADITHAGFLPAAFFDALAPGGSGFILGVTFTYIWLDAGEPTDIDNNGKNDTAFREIYYNDNFPWAIGANIEVETIALHEAGHGLSQAHFGTAFSTDANGKLHFSPRALMNAAYSGIQTSVRRTDLAGHCSIWDSW